MTEEKEKPVTLIVKITMPTKETIASSIQKLFPFSNLYDIKVSIEEEKPEEEKKPEEAPPAKSEG